MVSAGLVFSKTLLLGLSMATFLLPSHDLSSVWAHPGISLCVQISYLYRIPIRLE
jgi:hypothetical protein